MKKFVLTILVLLSCASAPAVAKYTPEFYEALKFTLHYEGGYFAEEHTNYGIMQPVYNTYRKSKGLATRYILKITMKEVEDIYYTRYYKNIGLDTLDPILATVWFDSAVNFGVAGAGRLDAGPRHCADQTERAIEMAQARIAKRHDIVKRKPSKRKFLKGWLRRDNALLAHIKMMIGQRPS